MKKILAVLTAVLLLFAACAAGAEGEFVYDTWDGNNSLKEYTGEGGDIVIPETVDGHTVTRVTGNIFSKVRDAVTGITFPSRTKASSTATMLLSGICFSLFQQLSPRKV